MFDGSGGAYHGVTRDSLCLMEAGEPITAARVIRYLSCHEETLYQGGKRAWQESLRVHRGSTIAPRDRVRGGLWSCPGWVCGHLLRLRSLSGSWSVVMSWEVIWSCPGSVVIFWFRNHFLGRRLWSCPASVVIFWVCVHFLDVGLWSCLGSVVITLVCGNFLARGLWSYPGWICHHFLNLWSFSGSWAVVMSFIGLWSSPGSVVIGHQGTMPASRRWGAYENQKITKEIVGIQP